MKVTLDLSYDTSYDSVEQHCDFDAMLYAINIDGNPTDILIYHEDDDTANYLNEQFTECPDILEDFVPYLRPIVNMTNEELEDYARYKFSSDKIWEIVDFKRTGKGFINVKCKNRNDASIQWTFQVSQKSLLENHRGIDWLNAHHFDYRGLIEKGLALEAPEGMYNI